MKEEKESESGRGDFPKIIWSAGQLADFMMMTPRNLQVLATKGVAVKEGRGKYDVLLTVQNYINDLRGGSADDDQERQDADARWKEERARLTKEQADQVEIKNALLRGEICLVEDAVALLRQEAGSVRAAVEGSEPVIIDDLAGKINTHAEVAAVVRSAHQRAMQKLTLDTDNPKKPKSNTIPKEFLPDDSITNAPGDARKRG